MAAAKKRRPKRGHESAPDQGHVTTSFASAGGMMLRTIDCCLKASAKKRDLCD
jgi:hypothetical protein